MELLTIRSFIRNGHEFQLWAYDPKISPLPEKVVVRDASSVLPASRIFRYKNTDQFGHGKGSLGGFSDIFRYKLLYEQGGWWMDMDVTCLKPFDFKDPYVFRTHHDMPVVGNIMKCPRGSELMGYCYERASVEVDENNRDWHLPIQILNDGIEKFSLSHYIRPITNPESWYENRRMIVSPVEIPDSWYAIHWINEEWRRNKINKNYSRPGSAYRDLLIANGLPVDDLSYWQRVLTAYRLSLPHSALSHWKAVIKPAVFLAYAWRAMKDQIGSFRRSG
jgi:hypothetical protein